MPQFIERTHLTSIRKSSLKTTHPAQIRTLLIFCGSPNLPLSYRSMVP